MEKKDHTNSNLALIITIIAIILVIFIIYLLQTHLMKNKTNSNTTNTNNAVAITNSTAVNNSVNTATNTSAPALTNSSSAGSAKSSDQIVRDLYSSNLKNNSEYTDYRIDNIKIEPNANFKDLYPDSKSNDIFATVTYSVKPVDMDAGLAGNGEKQGDWVVKKVSCLYVKYDNGNYKIAADGTGW